MTKDELIKSYQQKIDKAVNKKKALEEIIQDLNGRVYSETQKPVSNAFKREILEELQKNIIIRKSTMFEHTEIFAQTDNEYLELLASTIQSLGEN